MMDAMNGAKRLLVAEDDVGTRTGLAAVLREEGYEVDEAPDGEVAWSIVRVTRPDLVLTDLDMPNLSGSELIGRVRALYPRIPIVVLSAEDPIDAGRRCVALNADRFFSKPVNLDDILTFVAARFAMVAS
ncbi:MAG: response regulator [Nannocystales bacterium]